MLLFMVGRFGLYLAAAGGARGVVGDARLDVGAGNFHPHAFGDFNDETAGLDLDDGAVEATGGDNIISVLQFREQFCMLLVALHLGGENQEEHAQKQQRHDQGAQGAGRRRKVGR